MAASQQSIPAALASRRYLGDMNDRAHVTLRGISDPSRSISRILSWAIISLGRPVARRLLAPNLGLGEQRRESRATAVARETFSSRLGLAPGRVWPFHPQHRAITHPAGIGLCATGPRLTADGRYPLPSSVECGLSSLPYFAPCGAKDGSRDCLNYSDTFSCKSRAMKRGRQMRPLFGELNC